MNDPARYYASYYTRGAQEGVDFAEEFKRKLAGVELSPGRYTAEITVPHGPSRGGGVRGLQRIRLVPKTQGYPVVVIGSVFMLEARAELRTIEHLEAIYRMRFKKPLELNRVQYKDLLGRLMSLFESEYMKATMEPMPARIELDEEPPSRTERPRRTVAVVALAAVATILAIAAWVAVR
jgi:hypothetical protein